MSAPSSTHICAFLYPYFGCGNFVLLTVLASIGVRWFVYAVVVNSVLIVGGVMLATRYYIEGELSYLLSVSYLPWNCVVKAFSLDCLSAKSSLTLLLISRNSFAMFGFRGYH